METEVHTGATEKLKVLVVGNNPIELGRVFDSLDKMRSRRVMTEIAFDLKSAQERLETFQPDYILIDDNIGKEELKQAVAFLLHDRKTKKIPISVLKNSNYAEAINTGVMNYILKGNLSGESLYTELKNSLRFRKTQLYLYRAYKKRKGQLMRLFRKEEALSVRAGI